MPAGQPRVRGGRRGAAAGPALSRPLAARAPHSLAPRRTPAAPQVYTPYSKGATRHLAAFTTKGANAYLFVLSANDKQWGGGGEGALRKMLESFRA